MGDFETKNGKPLNPLKHASFSKYFTYEFHGLWYNVEGGNVEICLTVEKGKRIITVSDTGIGIPADLQKFIFEPFYRVDKSRSRQMGGASLGLPTVKIIIEKHHGEIKVCENPKVGTVFTVVL